MADFPDVYAEGFSVTVGPFGCIVTFSHILPTGEPGPHQDPSEPIARIRFSPIVGKGLADALHSIIATAEQGGLGTKTISH